MQTLGLSHLNFPTCFNQRDNEIGQESCFLARQKRVRNGFPFSLVPFSLVPFSLAPSSRVTSISASFSVQTSNEIEGTNNTMHSEYLPETVCVRFKLHKECAFGHQFLVVGDDPTIGSWDPSDGVPLMWSQDHVWSAEIDIPSGRVIKFKFVFKGDGEDMTWQPGPDRVLETWPTDNTITVSEDWHNPDLQFISEEDNIVGADVKDESLNISYLSVGNEEDYRRVDGERVLVPGLIPTPLEQTSDRMMMFDQRQQINGGAAHILENEFQWGRRTLEKILANLGI